MIVIKFLKKKTIIKLFVQQPIYHSLPAFPLPFACLPVDLSWNINYVDK